MHAALGPVGDQRLALRVDREPDVRRVAIDDLRGAGATGESEHAGEQTGEDDGGLHRAQRIR
jgi:hypothetical protein